MDKDCKSKLLACRTYAEAKPILETLPIGSSAHELAYTAFSIADKQPRLRDQFLGTVIQEAEEAEDKIKKEDTDKRDGLTEVDGGKSEQSSSTTGLESLGKKQSAPEGADAQPDAKDQMGVAINETFPMMPQGGQAPPPTPQPQQQQAPPPMGMPPAMPPMQPPKPPTPQQQQMQYIQEIAQYATAPYYNRLVEAVKAMDRKIQEIQRETPRELELGSRMRPHGLKAPIREIAGNIDSVDTVLENKRVSIEKLNNAINDGYIR